MAVWSQKNPEVFSTAVGVCRYDRETEKVCCKDFHELQLKRKLCVTDWTGFRFWEGACSSVSCSVVHVCSRFVSVTCHFSVLPDVRCPWNNVTSFLNRNWKLSEWDSTTFLLRIQVPLHPPCGDAIMTLKSFGDTETPWVRLTLSWAQVFQMMCYSPLPNCHLQLTKPVFLRMLQLSKIYGLR